MVKVDKAKCIGCGQCAAVCTVAFEMKNGKAAVKKGAKEDEKCIDEAIDLCPVDAISK
jgi:ferredoxin